MYCCVVSESHSIFRVFQDDQRRDDRDRDGSVLGFSDPQSFRLLFQMLFPNIPLNYPNNWINLESTTIFFVQQVSSFNFHQFRILSGRRDDCDDHDERNHDCPDRPMVAPWDGGEGMSRYTRCLDVSKMPTYHSLKIERHFASFCI